LASLCEFGALEDELIRERVAEHIYAAFTLKAYKKFLATTYKVNAQDAQREGQSALRCFARHHVVESNWLLLL